MRRRSMFAVGLATLAGVAMASAAAPGPWKKPYFPGSFACFSTGCINDAPHRGYLDRATVTASYAHHARATGDATNLAHFAVYASAGGGRPATVEWQVACGDADSSGIVKSQGTFRVVGEGRRGLKMPRRSTDECAAAATATGRGRIYVELDGVPGGNTPSQNFG